MVAKIKTGKRIAGVLHYNEHKVGQGVAVCIGASGYGRDAGELTFYEKLTRFEGLMELNPKVKTNTVHISLNFDPSEKPDDELLNSIAHAYMEKIGFSDQPYLVYRHNDAAHDHIHLVSTNIRADGSRIDLHNIGRNQSEIARKQLEEDFGLVKAEDMHIDERLGLSAFNIQRLNYGKGGTKRAITNIVSHVVKDYNYTSLAELNAALKKFNVIADRGGEGTRMFEKRGLIYSVLDAKGNKVGVPIKASTIYEKPTLPYLENRFVLNKQSRDQLKVNLKERLAQALQSPTNHSKTDFMKECRNANIDVMFRQSDTGRTYGVTFVDHRQKAVFKGSDIGKEFSASAIEERLTAVSPELQGNDPKESRKPSLDTQTIIRTERQGTSADPSEHKQTHGKSQHHKQGFSGTNQNEVSMLDTLFLPQWEDRQGPDPKLKRRRTRKQHR